MDFTAIQIIQIVLTVFCSSAIQNIIGFGFGLFAIPVLVSIGATLPQAVVIVVLTSIVQRTHLVISLRTHVHLQDIKSVLPANFIGLPVGILILSFIAKQQAPVVRQYIGGLILLAVLLRVGIRVEPRDKLAVGWGYVAGFFSGLMSGVASTGGPPIMLWVHTHKWSNERARVFLSALTLPLVPLQLALLVWKFGAAILPALLPSLIAVPLVIAGGVGGIHLGKHLPVARLRAIAFVLLAIIGLINILRPFLG
jgi:uncharacterized protein